MACDRQQRKATATAIFCTLGLGLILTGCSGTKDEAVLRVNGQEILASELNLLGATALAPYGVTLGTPQADAQLLHIASNLYDTLVDLYVIRHAAEAALEPASEEAVQALIADFEVKVGGERAFDEFLSDMNLDREGALEIFTGKERVERFQRQIMEEGRPELTEDDLKAYYYQHEDLFRYPNRARASHIVFAVEEGAGPEQWRRAQERAGQIRLQLVGDDVERFAEAAREYSQDIISGPNGGDLGFVARGTGVLPATLVEALFRERPGQIVGPVQTKFGYHLAMITAREMDFEQAKEPVKKLLEEQAMAQHFQKWLESEREKAKIERLVAPVEFFRAQQE